MHIPVCFSEHTHRESFETLYTIKSGVGFVWADSNLREIIHPLPRSCAVLLYTRYQGLDRQSDHM